MDKASQGPTRVDPAALTAVPLAVGITIFEDDGAWSWATTLVGFSLLLIISAFLRFPSPVPIWEAILRGGAAGAVVTMCLTLITTYPVQQQLLSLPMFPAREDMPDGLDADLIADEATSSVILWAVGGGVIVAACYLGWWLSNRPQTPDEPPPPTTEHQAPTNATTDPHTPQTPDEPPPPTTEHQAPANVTTDPHRWGMYGSALALAVLGFLIGRATRGRR
ncbi:hypothetical protein ACIBEJ_00440 [Nonomuraea sp. NPDC050790]|uniref:hypothetical protein n=1 Tax=Nonomuraea sp. NPDC050790 TaxID=3364371 RepID=UPI0037960813